MGSTENNSENAKRKFSFWVIITILYIVLGFTAIQNIRVNEVHQHVLIRRFGEVIDNRTVTEPGIYFKTPFIEDTVEVYTGERLYDLPVTPVITSDKKNMMTDAFMTWKVENSKRFYSEVGSSEAGTKKLDDAVYSGIKKTISATTQEEVIAGKDGRLSKSIMDNTRSMEGFGIKINTLDIKGLDLPEENKESVYQRMIAERQAITAKYTASGDKTLSVTKAQVDAESRQIVSEANKKAAEINADGEKQYYEILRDAYHASPDKEDFYKYWIRIEALRHSLTGGGTIQISEDNPLYQIIINHEVNSNP